MLRISVCTFVMEICNQVESEFTFCSLIDVVVSSSIVCVFAGNWRTPCRYACCTEQRNPCVGVRVSPQHPPSWHARTCPEPLGRFRLCARASQAPAWEKAVAEGGPGGEGAPRVSLRRASNRCTIQALAVSPELALAVPVLPWHERTPATQCAATMSVSFQWSCGIEMSADHLDIIEPSPWQFVCSWGKRRASRRRTHKRPTCCRHPASATGCLLLGPLTYTYLTPRQTHFSSFRSINSFRQQTITIQ